VGAFRGPAQFALAEPREVGVAIRWRQLRKSRSRCTLARSHPCKTSVAPSRARGAPLDCGDTLSRASGSIAGANSPRLDGWRSLHRDQTVLRHSLSLPGHRRIGSSRSAAKLRSRPDSRPRAHRLTRSARAPRCCTGEGATPDRPECLPSCLGRGSARRHLFDCALHHAHLFAVYLPQPASARSWFPFG